MFIIIIIMNNKILCRELVNWLPGMLMPAALTGPPSPEHVIRRALWLALLKACLSEKRDVQSEKRDAHDQSQKRGVHHARTRHASRLVARPRVSLYQPRNPNQSEKRHVYDAAAIAGE
jgi:hypothetical protein